MYIYIYKIMIIIVLPSKVVILEFNIILCAAYSIIVLNTTAKIHITHDKNKIDNIKKKRT